MEALSVLCNGMIRPEPLPSWFVGLFVQMVTTGHATGLEKTLFWWPSAMTYRAAHSMPVARSQTESGPFHYRFHLSQYWRPV